MTEVVFEVVLRVAAMSAVLCVLGLAPASWLPRDLPVLARLALIPPLGLAAGLGLLTCANWLMPAKTVSWLVLAPVMAASFAVAFRKRTLPVREVRRGEWGMIAALVVTVLTIFIVPLAGQRSVGPGAFQVFDAPNYVALIGGLEDNAIRDASWGPAWDFTARIGEKFGHFSVQQVGYDSIAATVNSLFRFEATTTQNAFMIVLILVGAFGTVASVAAFAPGWRPAWLLGGLLYAGPVTYQLWLDGSEAALAGLALLVPTVLFGVRTLSTSVSKADLVLFALLCAGFYTAYPLMFPTFVLASLMVLVPWFAIRLLRLRRAPRRESARFAKRTALAVAGVAVAAVAFSPWAFNRNLHYWYRTITNDEVFAGLPRFDLPFQVLPGYLLQTREFYFLPHLDGLGLKDLLLSVGFPVALFAIALFAIFRIRRSAALAAVAVSAAILAWWASSGEDCSYCVQRALLVEGPIFAALIAVGVAAVAALAFRHARTAAWIALAGVFLVVAHTDSVLVRRAAAGAYLMPKDALKALDAIDQRPGPLMLEGLGATFEAPGEFQAVLHAARERGDRRIAFPTETDDFVGLAYLGGPRAAGIEYVPDYRLVLTRLPAVETDRRVLTQNGPFALEQRTTPSDVTVISGVLADRNRKDPSGKARVNAPMTFWISTPSRTRPYLKVVFRGLPSTRIRTGPRAHRMKQLPNGDLEVCLAASAGSNPHRATITFPGVRPQLAPPPTFSYRSRILGGPTLEAMHVVRSCGR